MINKLVLLTFILAMTSSCAEKAFVKGKYEDVEKENLMNDQWSETDMQVVAKDLVKGLVSSAAIAGAKKPPIVIVTQLQNKTSEHIDTQSIMDMIRVELMNSGKVQFIDKEARDDIKNEYEYNGSGMVSEESKKTAGGQTGADFIINGRLDSITQEVGKDKTVYYKITLNLTNIKTSVMAWSDHKQIRKAFKKKSVGF